MLANTKLKIIKEFSGGGSNLKTAKYQKKICNNNEIFLNNSMYPVANPEAKGFEESLKIPKKKPKIVAKNIPITDTKIVFNKPTRYALP